MRKICAVLLLAITTLLPTANAADAPNLQNTVERYDPGKTAADISQPPESINSLPSADVVNIKNKPPVVKQNDAAAAIKFRLKKIILTGNTIYSSAELEKLYQNKLNTDVSLVDLEGIAQKITEYYRNAGYVLTQAIVPPQEINQEGIVKIKIIEGYINKVSISGCRLNSVCNLLTKYGNNIASKKPLNLSDLERYSFLANDIPGVKVRAVLTRSEEYTGASDLTFIVEEKNYGGSFAYNNYNSQVLGRQQFIANAYLNNLTSASETAVNGIISRNVDRMRYIALTHKQQLNSNGFGGRVAISKINTEPDMGTIGLGGLVIPGKALTILGSVDYAWIRSHSKNLYIGAGFKYLNSNTSFGGTTLFQDNIRSFNIYTSYNFLQSATTYNSIVLTLAQGVKLFGAKGNPPSRIGEDLTFTTFNLFASSNHRFGRSKLSSLIAFKGQYSFETVPSSETFAYGGLPFGAGYDPAEFTGDRGIAGLFELQYPGFTVKRASLSSQLFTSIDFGYVWDTNNVQPTAQSGSTAGVGFRANLMKHVNFDFMVAQPLKPSNIEGNAKYTRLLFNVKLYG